MRRAGRNAFVGRFCSITWFLTPPRAKGDVNQSLFLLGVVTGVSCEARLLFPKNSVSRPCNFIHFLVVSFQVPMFWVTILIFLTHVLVCMKFHKFSLLMYFVRQEDVCYYCSPNW